MYYCALRDSAHNDIYSKDTILLNKVADSVDQSLHYYSGTVKALAGLKDVREALSNDSGTHPDIDATLQSINAAIGTSVAYLLDQDGKTIASSNSDSATDFTGKNYSFRPYFSRAILGKSSIYMALGVTTGQRGIYFSSPVYSQDNNKILGVAVIKARLTNIEKTFLIQNEGLLTLTGPEGIIFVSSDRTKLFHSLWPLSDNKKLNLEESKQFGEGPWKWAGFKKVTTDHSHDTENKVFVHQQKELLNYPGWHVTLLRDNNIASSGVFNELKDRFGLIFLAITFLSGLFSLTLYMIATKELSRRKKAEKAVLKIAKGISGATGEDFFNSLSLQLVDILNADYAYVAEIIPDKPGRVKTLALIADGKKAENIEVDLACTPCAEVMRQGIATYTDKLQSRFPDASVIALMKVEGYIGTALMSSSGKKLGLMTVMYRSPIKNREMVESTLKIFAERAAAEIERIHFEGRLINAANEWQSTFNSISDFISIHDNDSKIIRANKALSEFTGIEPKDLIGRTCHDIFDIPPAYMNDCSYEKLLITDKPIITELYDSTSAKHLLITVSPLNKNGQLTGSVHFTQDITARKIAEQKLQTAHDEKEVLLREIHHRVTNNFQVIMSLLRMHSDNIESEKLRNIFKDSENRIRSMSLIHEMLYRSDNLGSINFLDYIKELTMSILRVYKISQAKIDIKYEINDIFLNLDTAIPCGLIISELVSNSLKHAFSKGNSGKIWITANLKEGQGGYDIGVRDNGMGMPANITELENETIGLKMVKRLVEGKLDGRFVCKSSDSIGAEFTFSFAGL